MSLTKLWIDQRKQLEGKYVRQIITFAGDGKLRDGSATSMEFREFLSHIPSTLLKQYLEECLAEKFDDSGFVLQDIVNQMGRRLGFKVTDGRYRGSTSQIGYDGIWEFPDGHIVILEVKTTDAYQVNLDTIAKYRRELISQGKATEDDSSILIVIGKEDRDTSGLEAQIRGSRHAWNVRLISVDALARLMALKEEVEDPEIIQRISTILIPREFTKLDEIINVVFSTAEDIREEEPEAQEDGIIDEIVATTKVKQVSFHEACIKRIEQHIQQALIKRSRTTYSTAEDALRLICAISKPYERGGQMTFWFAFHPHQKEFLEEVKDGYVAFGCGSEKTLLLIPLQEFAKWLGEMHTTEDQSRLYWHVNITYDGESLILHRKKGAAKIDLNPFLV